MLLAMVAGAGGARVAAQALPCIDVTNLSGPGVTAYTGTFQDPYNTVGLVNYGPTSTQSSHTVHTDTSERDSRIGGQLRTIPEGHNASTRLGSITGSATPAASAISYSITVDTNNFDYLLLRYACVLQNPSHGDEWNPYFRFEILNSSDILIDSCGYGNFISSQELMGWHTYDLGGWAVINWCDWQAAAFDVKRFHGQQIKVRLTNSKCAYNVHWAYTYFVIDCGHSDITLSTCRTDSTVTLTAPEGFVYRWYRDAAPGVTLGSDRELDVPLDGSLYRCDVSPRFRSGCTFSLSARSIATHAVPRLDAEIDQCTRQVSLTNRTVVANANGNDYDTVPYTGSLLWDFGNGQTSTAANPTITYDAPGTYTISLTTQYMGCTQRVERTVTIEDVPTLVRDTVAEACDSLVWHGSILDSTGTYTDTIVANPATGCDTVVMLHLTIHPRQAVYDTLHFCPEVSLNYDGVEYAGDTANYRDKGYDIFGCDSITRIALYHYAPMPEAAIGVSGADSLYGPQDTLMVACQMATLWLRDTSDVVEWRWVVSSANDSIDAADSVARFTLDTGIYAYRLMRTDTNGCHDTVVFDSMLIVAASPEADFVVSPEVIPSFEPTAEFINTSPTAGCQWLWSIDADTASSLNWHYTWPTDVEAGTVGITLVASLTHCIDTGDTCITLVCHDTATNTVEIVTPYLDFPSLVTPNGDGVNDTWGVVGLVENGWFSRNEVWIFNQWGVLVFHAENIYRADQWWDPEATASPDGTYFFRFAASNQYGIVKRNGVIEVLRGE